jgi:hypothetical protein
MYLRFVTTRIDKDSHKPQGVFAASYVLMDSGDLSATEWKRAQEILNWFSRYLPNPPDSFQRRRATFWFKSSSKLSIRKIWELIEVLRQHNHYVEVHKCRRLANVCYSDDFQVAAYPSDLDGRITIQ